ncbi:hypothetical protein [Methanococcoides sp. LMO-2]|uniref:DUF2254 domain-containing protein n=1 Tax=Methanococcoides cohabitans TaxID=3136559 RepID=A0ABU9KWG0_9EURY
MGLYERIVSHFPFIGTSVESIKVHIGAFVESIRIRYFKNRFDWVFFKDYFLPFFIILLASWLLTYLGWWNSNLSSAQYLVSAVVQAEAAILAIIVTLTLYVVQNAQSYSPRITEFFMKRDKNPHFWSIVVIYSFALIYGVFILKALKTSNSDAVSNLQYSLWVVCLLGVQAFLSLKNYVIQTLNLLKPTELINQLADDIKIDCFLYESDFPTDVKQQDVLLFQNETIMSIVDIIHTAILNHDTDMSVKGVDQLSGQVMHEIAIQKDGSGDYNNLLAVINGVLADLSKLAIKKNNYMCASKIAESTISIGIEAYNKTEDLKFLRSQHGIVVENVAYVLNSFENDYLASKILYSTSLSYAIVAKKDNRELSEYFISSIELAGVSAIGHLNVNTTKAAIFLILLFGTISKKNDNADMFDICDESAKRIIDAAVRHGQFSMLSDVSRHLSIYDTQIQIVVEKRDNGNYMYNGTIY